MAIHTRRISRHTRRTVQRILFGLLVVLVLIVTTAVGLGFLYYNADETAIAVPAVTLNGTSLDFSTADWYTPVLSGLFYKEFHTASPHTDDSVGTFSQPEIVVAVPESVRAELTVQDAAGVPLVLEKVGATLQARVPHNGEYHYTLYMEIPAKKGKHYGKFTYNGRFSMDVEPAIHFSSAQVPQGGMLLISVSGFIDADAPTLEQPLGETVFARQGDDWVAAVGIGYKVEPGTYVVTVHCGETVTSHELTVLATDFTKQYMTIDQGTVDTTVNSAAANQEWRDAIYPLYETADDTIYWQEGFADPLEKRVLNTEYGLFRYTNGSSSAERHSGIDLDGETGDAVHAAAKGRVVLSQFLALTGNTVVIEHGGGLKSYYFHMDRLACAQGDMVEQGHLIGAVGTTGYSTGAHLHFEVKLGRQSIDPVALIEGAFSLNLKKE